MAQNIRQKNEITKSHNLVKESIEYAELIQKAMLPKEQLFDNYFKESFVYLEQRDIVGGDFYSLIPLDEHRVVVMVLDSVGHGVSGAFMTMLIKATEHQISMEIANGQLNPKPSSVLVRFNELIKDMIHSNGDTKAIIGFDGGLFCFDKRESKVYYAGARMPLYVIQENELKYYCGSRKGIGFARTPLEQEFEEYEIEVTENTKLYLTSDGLLDQMGEDGLPYGKERFKAFLRKHQTLGLLEQSRLLQEELKEFKGNEKQLDDIIFVGFLLK
jgi:serine phosphatase RsbU (regulator of sigma subunit)